MSPEDQVDLLLARERGVELVEAARLEDPRLRHQRPDRLPKRAAE
jgi:hypothetical protein